MGELVDLARRAADAKLAKGVEALAEAMWELEYPTPQELGWTVAERAEDGTPVKYVSLKHQAFVGYVAGLPEVVYLDYRCVCRTFECSLEELAVGLETGLMPKEIENG